MSGDARAVVGELLAARNERSAERAGALLAPDVRYWDCDRGELTGRDEVAAVLAAPDGGLTLEALAAAPADAVAEVQVAGAAGPYRSTEVYAVRDGAIAELRAYFDPSRR